MRKELRLNKTILMYIICLIPFLEIGAWWDLVGSRNHYTYALISVGVLAARWAARYRLVYIDRFMAMFLGYEAITIMSTFLQGKLSPGILYSIFLIFLMLQLIHYDTENLTESLFYLFTFLLVVNFLSMFYFKEEVYIIETTPWQGRFSALLGGRNALCAAIFPMLSIICFRDIKKNGKLSVSCKLCIIIGLGSLILGKSSTGMVTVIISLILFAVLSKFKVTMKQCIHVFAIGYIVLVFFNNALTQSDLFLWILEKLNRNANMSSRPIIWSNALDYMKTYILLGVGRGAAFNVTFNNGYIQSFNEVHNMFLQVLFQSGIIGLICYIGIFENAIKRLTGRKSKEDKIFMICILCYLVGGLMESIQDKLLLFMMLGFAKEYAEERRKKDAVQICKNK